MRKDLNIDSFMKDLNTKIAKALFADDIVEDLVKVFKNMEQLSKQLVKEQTNFKQLLTKLHKLMQDTHKVTNPKTGRHPNNEKKQRVFRGGPRDPRVVVTLNNQKAA